MTAALDGLLVLDLTNFLSGPYCAMLLGDLGATLLCAIESRNLIPCAGECHEESRLIGAEASLKCKQERQAILELAQAARTAGERCESGRFTTEVINFNGECAHPLLQRGSIAVQAGQLPRDPLGTRHSGAQAAAILVQRLSQLVLQSGDAFAVRGAAQLFLKFRLFAFANRGRLKVVSLRACNFEQGEASRIITPKPLEFLK